jgi:hypothetical protein
VGHHSFCSTEEWVADGQRSRGNNDVDGYITGPDDGPGKGLGEGGEHLHYWVFGGPWTYAEEERRAPTGEDAA